jgi:hypothetical protein
MEFILHAMPTKLHESHNRTKHVTIFTHGNKAIMSNLNVNKHENINRLLGMICWVRKLITPPQCAKSLWRVLLKCDRKHTPETCSQYGNEVSYGRTQTHTPTKSETGNLYALITKLTRTCCGKIPCTEYKFRNFNVMFSHRAYNYRLRK